MAAVGVSGLPGLSEIENWSVAHLEDAAQHWTSAASDWEDAFTDVAARTPIPDGTPWEGAGAEAAIQRTATDRVVVRGAADSLHAAAGAARNGAEDVAWARQMALESVDAARTQGFTVGEDLSVTDNQRSQGLLAQAARQSQARSLAAAVRAQAQNLVAVDSEVGSQVTSAIAGVHTAQFSDAGSARPAKHDNDGKDPKKPKVEMVDDHTYKQDEGNSASDPTPPPVRGQPPDGLRPPVEGPLTPGPPSRAGERARGAEHLWDDQGGEWRYHPDDKGHNPHWDYKPSGKNAQWQQIPIGDLSPGKGAAPSIVSGLPPWMQNPAIGGVSGPPQNPLLAPFPGASMPAPSVSAPSPGPGLMPHISMPQIDLPTPSPGDVQGVGGATAAVGGGALALLLIAALSPT